MSISIVVPTHNRYSKVLNLLQSLRRHRSEHVDSVIVVDDSDVKTRITGFEDLDLSQVMVERRVFISKAKNIGWKSSSSEYVYFIDDDNVIDETTIDPAFDLAERSPHVGALMPAVLYLGDQNLVWVYATPFLNRRHELNLVGRNLRRNPELEGLVLRTDALPNASLVRRRAIEEVGGFDERLVVNSSLDFAQRLKAGGWSVIAFTGSKTFHDVELPGKIGWWASHGTADPARVRHEVRDSIRIARRLRRNETAATLSSAVLSLKFVAPNLLAYLIRGNSRGRLAGSILQGYFEGVLGEA
jgi:GT2 family glycosyltransferase